MRYIALALIAACQSGSEPIRVVPAPPAPVKVPAEPPATVAEAKFDYAPGVALLAKLGEELQAETDAKAPPIDRAKLADAHDLAVLDACKRPTPDERAAIGKQIGARDPRLAKADLTFGCVDPGGTIVAAAGEYTEHAHAHGLWSVLRVRAGGIDTLATYTGTAQADYFEYADENSLAPVGLVDLDGDGDHDAILAYHEHEGGSTTDDVTLSTWLSSTKQRSKPLDHFAGIEGVTFARAPAHAAKQPVVVQADDKTEQVDHRAYRCIEPDGSLDRCAAEGGVHAFDRALDTIGWFRDGHEWEPTGAVLPDREELGRELDALGVAVDRRAGLLAAMPPTTPGLQVYAIVARALAPRGGDDPRPAAVMAALGDAPCKPASAADRAKLAPDVGRWIAKHDAELIAKSSACANGAPCAEGKRSAPTVTDACLASSIGYARATWEYGSSSHEAVFAVKPGAEPVLVASGIGYFTGPVGCLSCPKTPPTGVDASFVMHGDQRVALVFAQQDQTLTYAHDGVATTVPAVDGGFASFDGGPPVRSAVRLAAETWHWDGAAWSKLPGFDAASPVPTDPAGAWLWHQARYERAVATLAGYKPEAWPDPAVRRAVVEALAAIADEDAHARIAGADAATRARLASGQGM